MASTRVRDVEIVITRFRREDGEYMCQRRGDGECTYLRCGDGEHTCLRRVCER